MSAAQTLPSRSFFPRFSRKSALLAVFLAAMTGGCSPSDAPADPSAEARIAPVARFELEGAAKEAASEPSAPAVASEAAPAAEATGGGHKDGATVYAQVCKLCHETGLSGAPKKGDKAAWSSRIAAGKDALYHSALNGKNAAMPAKGGNGSLSDAEVKSAVDFMVAASE